MSARPDISAALEPGETLLWRGGPRPGRPTPARANLLAAGLYAATMVMALLAWFIEVFHADWPGVHLISYGLVGSAAFATFLGFRITFLDRRRARARDARTAYAITDRRALALAGPYKAELALTPDLTVALARTTLTLTGPGGSLRFERLADAGAAHDLVLGQIGQTP